MIRASNEIEIIKAYLDNNRMPIMYKLPGQDWKVFDIPRAKA